ncbi:MAG: hypothetical protein NVS3B18_07140 [Candidatus Dormibacteria bacterium]
MVEPPAPPVAAGLLGLDPPDAPVPGERRGVLVDPPEDEEPPLPEPLLPEEPPPEEEAPPLVSVLVVSVLEAPPLVSVLVVSVEVVGLVDVLGVWPLVSVAEPDPEPVSASAEAPLGTVRSGTARGT